MMGDHESIESIQSESSHKADADVRRQSSEYHPNLPTGWYIPGIYTPEDMTTLPPEIQKMVDEAAKLDSKAFYNYLVDLEKQYGGAEDSGSGDLTDADAE